MKISLSLRIGAALCATSCVSLAWAQAYPSKPIRMITEFGAGAGGDIILRVVTSAMVETLGQPIIVENRAGAGGVVAAEAVVRAAPDGYTLGTYSPNALVTRRVLAKGGSPIDVLKDLTPITALGDAVMLVFVQPNGPIKSLKELIDYAKANPGKLSYGSSGFGSIHHLAQEQVAMITGANMLHIPYKTGTEAVAALVSGQIPVTYAILGSIGPHLRAGKVVPLARVGSTRLESMPQVPALTEMAPGFEPPPGWEGMFGPAGLPQPILRRLHGDAVKALAFPQTKTKINDLGFDIIGNTPEEFTALIKSQIELVSRIAKSAKIQPIE
ncbi:MAG: Bug family tripartite tricarboxylate transporter substrate binding protein [Burkholderiales bacterium]